MNNIMVTIMSQYGYIGVALLIAIENIFPPIPSEVILTFGGFMTTYADMSVWMVILAATVGSVLGAIALYAVGYLVSPKRLAKMLSGRAGRLLRLSPKDVWRAQEWFNSKGNLTVFFCRFIPIIRSLISIPAGMSKMNIWKFLGMTTAGTAIWNMVLVWLGAFAGASWDRAALWMDTYSTVGKIVLFTGIFLGAVLFYKKRKNT